jgi:hypothetical protein
MSRKVFTAGEVLAAADVNSFLMDQAVMSFAGTAARGSAIPSPVEGMTTFREDTDRMESWTGSEWTSPGDLVLIKSQTIGTSVSSVTVTGAFSAIYDAYKIIVSGGASTVLNANLSYLELKLGAAATGHNSNLIFAPWGAGSVSNVNTSNGGAFLYSGSVSTDSLHADLTLVNPFLTKPTYGTAYFSDGTNGGTVQLRQTGDTSFTDFTFSRPTGAGVMTGGNIAVYGYRKS